MNSHQFILQQGLSEAKKLLDMGSGHCNIDGYQFHTDELKQAVSDFEIVNIHGFDPSKKIIADAPPNAECYSWTLGNSGIRDKTVILKDLKEAIIRIEDATK